MYTKVALRLGPDIIEFKEYAPALYGAPGKRRKKKKNITPETVRKQNIKNRERWLQSLILLNFREGWNITLRYPKDAQPASMEEAKQNLRLFIASMRRALQQEGIKFEYLVVTEKGTKAGHYHHHLITKSIWGSENIDITKLIRDKWEKYGTTYHSKMHEEGNYKDLAAYLVKSETKEEQAEKNKKEGTQKPSYICSRGLKKPEVIKKETYRGDLREPEAPKGWYVDPQSIIQGINPYTGKKYQRYYIKNTPEKVIEMVLEKKEITAEKTKEEPNEEPKNGLPDINLYIKTKVENGVGDSIYLLEFIMKDGNPYLKPHHAAINGNKEKITLYALLSAIKHINKPANIRIFTQNTLVRSAIKQGWIEKWKKQNWKNNKNEPIDNADMWKQLLEASKRHNFEVALKEDEKVHGWSLQQLERIAEKFYKRKEK